MPDWFHQSIHEAIEAHRTRRRRCAARRKLEEIYGPTRVFSAVIIPAGRAADRRAFRAEALARRTELVRQILSVQGGRCYLCPEPFAPLDGPTLDHVRPIVGGGGNAGNLLLAHRDCNGRKGGRAPHPCELLFLEAVNAALDERLKPLGAP